MKILVILNYLNVWCNQNKSYLVFLEEDASNPPQVVFVVDGGELPGQCLKVEVVLDVFGLAEKWKKLKYWLSIHF